MHAELWFQGRHFTALASIEAFADDLKHFEACFAMLFSWCHKCQAVRHGRIRAAAKATNCPKRPWSGKLASEPLVDPMCPMQQSRVPRCVHYIYSSWILFASLGIPVVLVLVLIVSWSPLQFRSCLDLVDLLWGRGLTPRQTMVFCNSLSAAKQMP